jgi:hypothetical protein
MSRKMLDSALTVTPVVATTSDVENGDAKVHAEHDDLPRSDGPKCGTRGRRCFAISAILLIAVAVAVTLALVLQPEPAPPSPPQDASLSELLSYASSDTEELWLNALGLNGTIPTEIGEFTKLSEYYDIVIGAMTSIF